LGIATIAVLAWAISQSPITALAYAACRSTSRFAPDRHDSSVMFEPGAERLAQVVAESLPQACKTVEEQQYRPFSAPVRVYVCASLDSFESYCPGRRKAAGCVINKRLFLSPKLESTPERVPKIITHELSHLHLQQRVGAIRLQIATPPWFQEGLAVYVSSGGGAESVSEDQARQSIADGKHLVPEESGSLFFRQEAPVHGLSHHMFYRQSAMFIDYLKRSDEQHFKALLAGVDRGDTLGTAFAHAYGRSLNEIWREFVTSATMTAAGGDLSSSR
jgi:hypothetical protein